MTSSAFKNSQQSLCRPILKLRRLKRISATMLQRPANVFVINIDRQGANQTKLVSHRQQPRQWQDFTESHAAGLAVWTFKVKTPMNVPYIAKPLTHASHPPYAIPTSRIFPTLSFDTTLRPTPAPKGLRNTAQGQPSLSEATLGIATHDREANPPLLCTQRSPAASAKRPATHLPARRQLTVL